MSNNGRVPEGEKPAVSADPGKDSVAQDSPQEKAKQQTKESRAARGRFSNLQSAMRFPLKLPVAVKSEAGERAAETSNISANGVLFQVDEAMSVGSTVEFSISVPAEIAGSSRDVLLDCRGRVVRCVEEGGRRGVGVVIDEYHLERR
jgi:hypothetical protein